MCIDGITYTHTFETCFFSLINLSGHLFWSINAYPTNYIYSIIIFAELILQRQFWVIVRGWIFISWIQLSVSSPYSLEPRFPKCGSQATVAHQGLPAGSEMDGRK